MKDVVGGLLILVLVFVVGYVMGKAAVSVELAHVRGQVEQQGSEAQAQLDRLTAERDERQARLDRLSTEQEQKDAHAETEIARLAGELERRPVRVRIVTEAGRCSAGAPGDATAGPEDRARHTGTAYGVLPDENTRRLGAALTEIETLSAAYSSCRATLLSR